ncbi:MAG: hypothetical protein QNL62_24695 [Gammaproteobacteria bacterium]|nr:hypothetical protein [Gammaproteobacteria bacterium]
MDTKLTSGALVFSTLLMASQVNAATIQLSPVSLTISVSSVFSMRVQGIDFAPTNGGGFSLSWDPVALQLMANESSIFQQLVINGFILNDVLITQGQLDVTISTYVADLFFVNTGPVSGNFDIAILDFLVSPPPSGVTDISFSTIQPAWVDENNVDLIPALQPNYIGATITVTAVTVPVPAAVWLFGSGLLGLIGTARRKARA